jgi:kanamycin nucleotidyltransferase
MWQGPVAQTQAARMAMVERIVAELQRTYGADLLGVALYGSLARGEDGPHSDIELFCVINQPGVDFSHEWVYGPGKAEVNLLGPDVVRTEAAEVDERWSLSAGQFVRCRPLLGDPTLFDELRALPFSAPKAVFDALIGEMVVGELYEWIGKLRNGQAQGNLAFVPDVACSFVSNTALLLGLVHRRLYSTGAKLLQESLALPDLPAGYAAACALVMAGDLADHTRTAAALETLWAGLGPSLARHAVDLSVCTRWPWEQR